MNKDEIESLARSLRRQRETLFQKAAATEEDLRFIVADRESELEERAQEERTARLLSRLDDRSIRAIEEIDWALRRIAIGSYGFCEGCNEPIPVERLRSLPAIRFCLECVQKGAKPPPAAAELTHATPRLSGELALLTDSELEAAIREHLEEDKRVDPQELKITCRRGVVYLYGALPSAAEHQILLQIVTDVLGLKEVVDRIQVEELLWEREIRTKAEPEEPQAPWSEPPGTEDIVENSEEGKDYAAPANPTPEEEE